VDLVGQAPHKTGPTRPRGNRGSGPHRDSGGLLLRSGRCCCEGAHHTRSRTAAIAAKATHLGAFHGDPADRLIVATAIVDAALIVTRDRNIRTDHGVTGVW
jgi:hypothetical protein